jgi:uncharacterized protein
MKTPLYVSRRLINTKDFIAWAKKQGFLKVVTPADIHVTIAYSSTPVDTSKRKPLRNTLVCDGGKRSVSTLGNEGAIVLFFESNELRDAWDELIDIGASWDYEEYNPHIIISYEKQDIDLSKIKPYDGILKFKHEVYEPLNTEWSDDVVHESLEILRFSEFIK